MKRSGRHRSGAHAKRRRARIARRAAFRLAYWRRRSGIGLLVWEDLGPLVPAAADTFKSFLDFLESRRGNPLDAFRIPVEASPLVDFPVLVGVDRGVPGSDRSAVLAIDVETRRPWHAEDLLAVKAGSFAERYGGRVSPSSIIPGLQPVALDKWLEGRGQNVAKGDLYPVPEWAKPPKT